MCIRDRRYNRVSVITGEEWNAPGGGIIESVDEENSIVYVKLEPGEVTAVEVDDICKAKDVYKRQALQSGGNTLHGVLKTLGERPEASISEKELYQFI